MLCINPRDCLLTIQTGECFSFLRVVVTERGSSLSITAESRTHGFLASQIDHQSKKCYRYKAGSGWRTPPPNALPQNNLVSQEDETEQGNGLVSQEDETEQQNESVSEKDETAEVQSSPATPVDEGTQYLLSGFGWNIRDINTRKQKDLQDVALIQAEAFHTPAIIFNEFFYDIFKAEVLMGLTYKVRLSPPKRYTCLVAESEDRMVGVVDLTALDDSEVLAHLQGADEYLYVSGLAVDANYRRRNVATALLQGVDLRAKEWGFKHLVLHAYEDDLRARGVYSKAGYKVAASDPPWKSVWIGRKRRVLMTKLIEL